ncbi:G/U mismatch-specific uracil-DNA glycosylase [Ruminococcaceae bacterium FB2012]|nr:G/U mismatch-specific uracil-DNA glycosylase [Ruminococcaceae bacterium FB2012]
MEHEHIIHGFDPVYDENSRVLILGSLPSVKSREQNFYYGHSQNRFWRLIAALRGESVPQTVTEKKELLLRSRIAVWDVIAECDIIGSSDTSIRNAVPADIRPILEAADIRCIFVNGAAAGKIYDKYQKPLTGREAVRLPSTSPANAAFGFERLLTEWSRINEYL